MTKRITVGLVWHSLNSDNLGVGALTLSNIELLRKAADGLDVRFLAIGWRDPRPIYVSLPDVEHVPIRTRHLVSPTGPFANAIARSDIVFDIGGGDSFTDIYGTKRFLTVWGTKLRSVLARKPLILSPQTIGPFNRGWSRSLATWSIQRAKYVVTRDAPSTRYLAEIAPDARSLEATDVAMWLPYETPAREPEGPIRVGLNISGLLFNGGYTQSNQFGLNADYADLSRRIVAAFVNRPNVEVHLIGHVQSHSQPIEDDHRVSQTLADEFPGTVVSPFFGSPTEAKSYIAGMDFMVAARMHAAIAAFSSGVPVVPLAYSRKFQGVFGTLGYDRVADCRSESMETILQKVTNGFEQRGALATEIERAMKGVDARMEAYIAMARSELMQVAQAHDPSAH